MYKLLIELKSEVDRIIDSDFPNLEIYHDHLGQEYQLPKEVALVIRKSMDPPEHVLPETVGYHSNKNRERDRFFQEYSKSLRERLYNILEGVLGRETHHPISQVIDSLDAKQKEAHEKYQGLLDENSTKIKDFKDELEELEKNIDQLEKDKSLIKNEETLNDISKRLENLKPQAKELEEDLANLEAFNDKEEVQSIQDKIKRTAAAIENMKSLSKDIALYYDPSEFSLNKIEAEEKENFSYLLDLLNGKLPDSYLASRYIKLKQADHLISPPEEWKKILSKIIKNDNKLKFGVWVKVETHENQPKGFKNFQYIFGRNDRKKGNLKDSDAISTRDNITAFRLAMNKALDSNPHVIYDRKEVIFKIAKRTAVKLKFRKLPKNKKMPYTILLHTTGSISDDQNQKKSIRLGMVTPKNLPHGYILKGFGYRIDVSFFEAYLLVND